LVDPSRHWIREGPITYVSVTGPEKCYLYLLSDSCILAQILPDDSKKFDKHIKLNNSSCVALPDTTCKTKNNK